MMSEKIFLCSPNCPGGCPAVELETDRVRIGEDDNSVMLTREEWNILVNKIQKKELKAF